MKESDIEIIESDNNIPPEKSILANKFYCLPSTKVAKDKHRIEDWIDLNEIETVSGYEDLTITIGFKSGKQITYGPFTSSNYDEVMNVLVEREV